MNVEQSPAAAVARVTSAAHQWSVVVPVLNDSTNLRLLLPQLVAAGLEVVVSDGGSTDNPAAVATEFGAKFCRGAANRGAQLQRGLSLCTRHWIWFLHCDSQLDGALLLAQLAKLQEPAWGRFDVRLAPSSPGLRCIGWFMNQRSRRTRICTGDQGMFVHRQLLDGINGVPPQPLMEDIELSKRLKRQAAAFIALPGPLTTSARRWRSRGLLATVLQMWWLRLRYWSGSSAAALAAEYYGSVPGGERVDV